MEGKEVDTDGAVDIDMLAAFLEAFNRQWPPPYWMLLRA